MDTKITYPAMQGDSALPFIIGITGHRDIQCLSSKPEEGLNGVKQEIKSCLLHWKKQLGDATPIWLLSGMAKGSDLLAVEAAEELISEGWPADFLKIIPCLPMPQTAFENDFDDQKSLAQLRFYLEKYQLNTLVVKSKLPQQRYLAALSDHSYQDDRNSLYLNQGAFLARYSNVLLCLWDGHDSLNGGGTADVAKLKLGIDVHRLIEDQYVSPALKQPGY